MSDPKSDQIVKNKMIRTTPLVSMNELILSLMILRFARASSPRDSCAFAASTCFWNSLSVECAGVPDPSGEGPGILWRHLAPLPSPANLR
jgi:hypothetical protein